MTENFIILIVFILALGYLGNLFKKSFLTPDDAGCAKGCSPKCTAQKSSVKPLPIIEKTPKN